MTRVPNKEGEMKMKKILAAVLAGLMFMLAIFPSAVQGQVTLYVDDDGAECSWATYTTIQAAVSDASNGDTIYVCAGTYSESVIVVGFTSLTIEAQGAGLPDKSVKVNPTPVGSTDGFYVESDGVTIEGFEIADTNFGIWFEGSYNKFSNNYIHDIESTTNWWDGGVGISLWDMDGGSNYNSVANNIIEKIERTGILLDVAWTDGGTGINTGNTINRNRITSTPWGAIEVLNAQRTTTNHNVIADCGAWGIALLSVGIASNDNMIAHNEVQGAASWAGIMIYPFYGGTASYNTVHHNSVPDASNPYWDLGANNRAFKNSWQ